MTPELLQAVEGAIREAADPAFKARDHRSVSGGDINSSYRLSGDTANYFVKVNNVQLAPMMHAECVNLQALAASKALAVPKAIAVGQKNKQSFLVLEYCPMSRRGDAGALGRGLAQLHKETSAKGEFGWPEDNFIGSSPQINGWHHDWPTFWWEKRLHPQLSLAFENGHEKSLGELARQLEERLPALLADHEPSPSLLHGDLWGGNAAFLENGAPIIYDPASYYGDRETDIALTELFGGFAPEFYEEYQKAWPLDAGYAQRKRLYNLYHLLNHLNLFGSGYLSQCRQVMQSLVI